MSTTETAAGGLPLRYEKHGAVALITLDRPASRHALTPEMLCRFADAVTDFAADSALRVAILTATGEAAFCAGGDLQRSIPLLAGACEPQDEWDRRVLHDPVVMAASSLREFPLDKPIVAAINGTCMAAGFEIMLGTDIRIAAEHASFALPEVRRGVVPFAGSMVRLPRQIPHALAMELMLVGGAISAEQAQRCGLINRVVPATALMDEAWAVANAIAANAPLAVQRVKHTVREGSGRPLAEGYRLEDETRRIVLGSEDAREGPRAFMEKRAPRFVGR